MPRIAIPLLLFILLLGSGCRTAAWHRRHADDVASQIISETQQKALGKTEPLEVESPADTLRRRLLLDQNLPRKGVESLGLYDLPDSGIWDPKKHLTENDAPAIPWAGKEVLPLSLLDVLQIGARNSREYQDAKEKVFRSALNLDLEREAFRNTFAGLISGLFESDLTGAETVNGVTNSDELSLSRKLSMGAGFTARVGLDLVKLLTQDKSSSMGLFADATVSIPLLRGSGKKVVREPLTQAERDVLYAIYDFEQFKKTFCVQMTSQFLSVIEGEQRVLNAEENYKRLIASTRRARRLADAGKLPEFQFDQSIQDELRARERWVLAQQGQASAMDAFKVALGLPPDARVTLNGQEIVSLRESLAGMISVVPVADYSQGVPSADEPVVLDKADLGNKGPWEMDPEQAVGMALKERMDLEGARSKIEDAQRKVGVAADSLRAGLNLLGSGEIGEHRALGTAGEPDAELKFDQGQYSALLDLDLPLERTVEREAYRNSLISLEKVVRDFQAQEDQVKLDIRDGLRGLIEARESLQIQVQSVALARKRVSSTDLFLQAGRAAIRDVLEAQESLLSAENALISALVRYRTTELGLQRDLGVLEVGGDGVLQEGVPEGE